MDLEEAFQLVGEFGGHQKRMVGVLVLLQVMLMLVSIMVSMFTSSGLTKTREDVKTLDYDSEGHAFESTASDGPVIKNQDALKLLMITSAINTVHVVNKVHIVA